MSIDLIFLSNELITKQRQQDMRIPLEFVTFAHIKGKMYSHFKQKSTFILPITWQWGNDVVYGAIFHLKDVAFYIRILDAYHLCSMSTLRVNHARDLHHRVTVDATPLHFTTLDEFERLKYTEREPIQVETYLGNLNHPKINQRLNKRNSYRIIDGLDPHFKNIIREELP